MKGRWIYLIVFTVSLVYGLAKDRSNNEKTDIPVPQQRVEDIEKLNYEDSKKLAYDFGYAITVISWCRNFNMKISTEEKITKKIGGGIRKPDDLYNEEFRNGLWAGANDSEQNGFCDIAWSKYGCYGSEEPKLVQENYTPKNRNGVFCEY